MEAIFNEHKPSYVFHAAAYKHVPMMEKNPKEAVITNVIGTRNLADLAIQFKIKKFVFISSDKAVNPTNIMGCSKRIAEMYVQSLAQISQGRTKFITTRFGNVLGSNGSVIQLFTEQIKNGGPVTVTHPEITRYFMTIPEACELALEAGMMGTGGEIFVFDMGRSIKIVDLAKKMIKLAGLEYNKDIKIDYTGLRLGEKLYEELLANKEITMPTHHKKILIGKTRRFDYYDVAKQINQLKQLTDTGTNMEIVKYMKLLVPEFISNNSKYSILDIDKPKTKVIVSNEFS